MNNLVYRMQLTEAETQYSPTFCNEHLDSNDTQPGHLFSVLER